MKIAVTVIGIMVMCLCTGSISKDNHPAPELKHHKQCRFPKGKHGAVHTDGCIRSTCMYGKWKPKMRTDICCYKQKVFKPMSMLDTIVSADNCSTIISCGAHAEMEVDKNCGVPATKQQVETLETKMEQQISDVKETIANVSVNVTCGKKSDDIYETVKKVDKGIEDMEKEINSNIKNLENDIEDKFDDLKNASNWQSKKVNHQIEELTTTAEEMNEKLDQKVQEINSNIKNLENNIEDKVDDLKNASNWQSEKINRQIEELTIQMENATQHSVEIYSNIETLETDVKSLAQTIQDNIKDQAQMTQQIMSTLASLTQMMVKHTMVQGVIITGGNGASTSTELFLPESGKTCSLQSLPDNRLYHTMDNLAGHIILCGGSATQTSCLEFLPDSSSGSWAHYGTLAQGRWTHTTYSSKDSEQLMLMGGQGSQGTTEILGEGGQFSLQQDTSAACSIPEQSSTILTGGYVYGVGSYLSSVVRYDYQGYVEDLPDLATARHSHGCGYYEDNGDKVLVVVGGWNGAMISTTELLTPGAKAWSHGESLPRTLAWLTSVNMDGFMLLIGGYSGGSDRGEVLKFAGTWTEVGRMKNARNSAAATTIELPREGGILDISACI